MINLGIGETKDGVSSIGQVAILPTITRNHGWPVVPVKSIALHDDIARQKEINKKPIA